MKALPQCRLYAFVDTAYLRGRDPADVTRQLCDGGADLIQLRAKDLTTDEITRVAKELLPITSAAGVWLVINDHPAVATKVGAPACHLGQEDFFGPGYTRVSQVVSSTRGVNPPRIGLSTHDPPQAERAIAAGADYIGVGPVYPTATKPGAKPATIEYVRWAAAHVNIPWFAIGGINLRNLDEVLSAGARRVCVVSAILTAPDVAGTCQQFRNRLLSAGL